ncbi:dinitrogenase iron-molybdenum cofactor biosynthesis protein [Thermosipho melanesiensis]|uniref:Dinitrogenase iron-molybdenum cofactor biosynthesis protein n=2 Tax=Thermosipho melanesiensis TaxID=46541 RepID=A6LKL6_THEM4|nr:NifB/NifX family molybdenum-iron cluster-binding protein [Thermosipho melanesiensis]ABR30467.1 Dinitrogenase iron-molybdenum cofactor biosynthesis protein [Thermosipho melanesiensis BI429]APT73625.1 dinitrogenase iron-molybdenum cofactor biosynthesis protein [Thermosipho melanesiensis]OOC37574.1 dinitrogenase iron-molybdenum cofactor biosynthesis protein [Thermosipho melanesiensis]OOC39470.1 dinitrogenase iron-molybdenum cofactor biosynthesis protein [Thermosipho melanesiensis]OOC39533.1 di
MVIAVPIIENNGENSVISEHFGHAPYFAFFDTEKQQLIIEENPLEEHNPGDIPNYIYSKGANVLIVRGIGQRAIQHFQQLGIEVIRGASGTVKELIQLYLENNLKNIDYKPNEKFHNY